MNLHIKTHDRYIHTQKHTCRKKTISGTLEKPLGVALKKENLIPQLAEPKPNLSV